MRGCIVNGVIHPVDAPVIPQGFVAWAGERVTAVGPMEALPRGDLGEMLDAAGGHVTPGYVDAHCHLGLFPDGEFYDRVCVNEDHPIAPEFSPLDRVDLADRTFAEARAAGVAAVVTGPGSAGLIGGQMVCLSTDGAVLQAPAALKLALGETPERALGTDAAGLLALLRESLSTADGGALAAARRGQLPVHIHAHRAKDIAAALELKESCGLRMAVVHGTEGQQVARQLAEAGVAVITGPCLTDRSRPELRGLSLDTPAVLSRAGVAVAICTDHPEVPIQYLPLCAGLAVRGGMTEEEALAAITLVPAAILGLEGRLGSLTPGKEAHIVVTPGPLFHTAKGPDRVILHGERVI